MRNLHTLYHSPNIIGLNKVRKLRWTRDVARMKEGKSALKILAHEPARKVSA